MTVKLSVVGFDNQYEYTPFAGKKLPLTLVAKGELNGIYTIRRYNMGAGDMLLILLNV